MDWVRDPARCHLTVSFLGKGSPTKIDYRKKGYPRKSKLFGLEATFLAHLSYDQMVSNRRGLRGATKKAQKAPGNDSDNKNKTQLRTLGAVGKINPLLHSGLLLGWIFRLRFFC